MPQPSRLDFSALPVIDNHCHLFNTAYVPHELTRVLNMSLHEMPKEQLQYTMIYRRILKEFRALLRAEQHSDEELLAIREQRMQENYQEWVSELFDDASIETLLIDLGYKPAAVELPEFERLVPASVYYMFRIESVLDDLWRDFQSKEIDFRTVEETFFQALSDAFETPELVAVKSIIGYRTGLAVQPVNRRQMLSADPGEKAFRDYFLLQSLEKTIQQDLPFQIHAAFGESNINILNNNPILLKELLEHSQYQEADIVLVHGGHPYNFEAGYFASVYPNVYVDISEMFPFVPVGSRLGLSKIFDMCPFNKILYGSDGFILPDIHWLGAKIAKDALESLFSEFIDMGLFDRELALQVAKMVLSENAQKLYRLPMF